MSALGISSLGFLLAFVGAIGALSSVTDGWDCVSGGLPTLAAFGAGMVSVAPLAVIHVCWNKRALGRLSIEDERRRDLSFLGLVNSLPLLVAGGVSALLLDFALAAPPAPGSATVIEPRLVQADEGPDAFYLVVTGLEGPDEPSWVPVPQGLHDRARPFDTLRLQLRRGRIFSRVFVRQPELEPQAPAPTPRPDRPEAEGSDR